MRCVQSLVRHANITHLSINTRHAQHNHGTPQSAGISRTDCARMLLTLLHCCNNMPQSCHVTTDMRYALFAGHNADGRKIGSEAMPVQGAWECCCLLLCAGCCRAMALTHAAAVCLLELYK